MESERIIKVFISYAKEDWEIAQKLYDDLSAKGLVLWMDRENLLPGQNWKVIIPQALTESDYILILLSAHAVSKRGYVQKEIKFALDLLDECPADDILIIPVRLDNCEPFDERLQNLHWVDLCTSYETGLKQILRVLRRAKTKQPQSTENLSSPSGYSPNAAFTHNYPRSSKSDLILKAQSSISAATSLNQYEKLLSWLNKLIEAEFRNMIYALLTVEQQHVLSQPVNRGNFLGDLQTWRLLDKVEQYLCQKYPERFSC